MELEISRSARNDTLRRTPGYFSFLLRGWKGADESGETVWRFVLVAPADGSTYRLDDLGELLQFLSGETAQRASQPADQEQTKGQTP